MILFFPIMGNSLLLYFWIPTQNFQKTLQVTKELVEGRPADKIVETAKEGMFDLIVIGSRGLGGIKEFFLGSVSNRVADKAPCPVLIVK